MNLKEEDVVVMDSDTHGDAAQSGGQFFATSRSTLVVSLSEHDDRAPRIAQTPDAENQLERRRGWCPTA
jgi:hypothetical protein